MTKALELTNKIFGKLTVQNKNTVKTKSRSIHWDCLCKCGNKVTVAGSNLIRGSTTSCGCYRKEQAIKVNTIHDMSYTKTYMAWSIIIQRCTNKNSTNYKCYGAKGIEVCDRWLSSFQNFLTDMGPKPPGKSILKRIQTDGNYEKNNCKWVVNDISTSKVRV
jgi:hypothetical protein